MTIYCVCTKGQMIDAEGTKFFLNRDSAEAYYHTFDRTGDKALFTYHDKGFMDFTHEVICCSNQKRKNLMAEVDRFNRCNAYQKDKVYATIEWAGKGVSNDYQIIEISVEK